MSQKKHRNMIGVAFLILLSLAVTACSGEEAPGTRVFNEEVSFTVEGKELNGILTHPAVEDPYPAIVLLHGAARSGAKNPYFREHAMNLVESGFAVLRYDGPGWGGQSSESPGFETLDYRTEEAIEAVKYLQSRPDIKSNAVGLWGISQGGWICQMAAGTYEGVAFIIPVSGPGVSPAEQEIYRVEAQSKAIGFDEDEVAKAVLIRRLMVDIVIPDPIYQAVNQSEAMRLGKGSWDELVELTYGPDPMDPDTELKKLIEVLDAIKDEPWTEFLYLDEQVLPLLESLPPNAWDVVNAQMGTMMDMNPADFLTKVHVPVLAIFGEEDTMVPVDRSVALYEKYLKEAGNEDVTIKVFPATDHSIQAKGIFAPGYFETMNNWLTNLYDE